MKKIISILVATGIIATVGTVVVFANESDTSVSKTATTESIPEKTMEEGTEGAEATTENMETSTDSDEATNSDASTTAKGGDHTTGETIEEVEVIAEDGIENGKAKENDSEKVSNDDISRVPQIGNNRRVFSTIATLIVSGVALAYCWVKGKKNRNKKMKKDGE